MTDAELVAFLQWALPRRRLWWPGFRRVRRQVRKRLARRLRALGLESLDAYRHFLGRRAEEWEVLDSLCRVTISRFYRDRAVFDRLRDPLLPGLADAARERGDRALTAWSAGCASGEEPYTLSLAWALDVAARVPDVRLEITATDADARLLERARRAVYPPGALRELPAQWREEAFEPVGDELRLRPPYRERVRFSRQDVRTEAPDGPFDLILCRNLVFTYFEPQLRAELLERILERLRRGGLLVIGGHESLPEGAWPLERAAGALPVFRAR